MSKHNAAKKTPVIPTIGTILVVHNDAIAKKTGPAKVVSIDHEHGNIKIYRPGSRTPWNVIKFSSLRSYWYTDESKFPGIDFNEANGGLSTLTNTEPSQSKANYEEPKSEPPPPPNNGETGWQFADNGTAIVKPILDFLQKQRDDELAEIKKRLDREEQARREDTKALHETVANLAKIVTSKLAELPAKSAADVERDAKAEKDAQLTARHKAEFKELLIEFTLAEFDRVDPATPFGRERALSSGEVYKLFAAWCEQNKKHNERPYQHAIFSLLDNHPHRRDHKVIEKGKRSNGDKVLTEYVPKNRKQTALPFPEPPASVLKSLTAMTDAKEIFSVARGKVWPNISDTYIETIRGILESGEFTKADLLGVFRDLPKPPRYTPAEILTPTSLRVLVRREPTKTAGGAK